MSRRIVFARGMDKNKEWTWVCEGRMYDDTGEVDPLGWRNVKDPSFKYHTDNNIEKLGIIKVEHSVSGD